MTREEAKKIFEYLEERANTQEPICDHDCEHCTWTECPIEPCDDAISREAVDNYIVELLSGYLYDEERERLEKLSAYLWELPSVTQKPIECTDAVSRADVVDLIEQAVGDKNVTIGDFTFGKSLMLHHIEQLPSVTQKSDEQLYKNGFADGYEQGHKDAEQKSGKWDASCTCSVCGQWRILESEKNGGKYKFCPNCGARMESEE